ncbi:hypothetical protein BHE74_00056154 [Ensete ventricosum]|nr:hypothetical protein BHE74_00056154 [Ensete ventricosum]
MVSPCLGWLQSQPSHHLFPLRQPDPLQGRQATAWPPARERLAVAKAPYKEATDYGQGPYKGAIGCCQGQPTGAAAACVHSHLQRSHGQ